MKRREFMTLLGGLMAMSPIEGRAQPSPVGLRRIGVLAGAIRPDDPESLAEPAAFVQGLQQLGWIDGRNGRIEYRWGLGNAENIRKYAAELVALAPDVILIDGTATIGPMVKATRTVPIVFVNVADPVGAGFVDGLARPGGNVDGFLALEYGVSGKWLELLRRGRTQRHARCDPARSRYHVRHWTIRCDRIRSAVLRRRRDPGRHTRRQ